MKVNIFFFLFLNIINLLFKKAFYNYKFYKYLIYYKNRRVYIY